MKIILPLSVILPRKTKADKVFMLNLNVYRNAHHMILNQTKIAWKDIVSSALAHWIAGSGTTELNSLREKPLCFTYTIYPGSGRKFDIGNVCSIIQKFTDDALIELGVIKDDNYKIIREVIYRVGYMDKERPRAELDIKSF